MSYLITQDLHHEVLENTNTFSWVRAFKDFISRILGFNK